MKAPANDSSSPGSEATNHGLNILFETRPLNVNTQMILKSMCASLGTYFIMILLITNKINSIIKLYKLQVQEH